MGNLPSSTVLRQPPPPGLHLIEAHKEGQNEEGNAMMNFNNNTNNNNKRCKIMKPTDIHDLPSDLVFEILTHLPAQHIYDLSKLVCWKWYRMIHTHPFIHTHLHRSTPGLLIQPVRGYHQAIFISMRQGRFETSKLRYKFTCPAYTSSNGLVLGFQDDLFDFYILNPATKQHFTLPRFRRNISYRWASGIAYAPASKEYKVVLHFVHHELSEGILQIVTVGVDESWRAINIQHLPPDVRKACGVFVSTPLITEGFMHWIEMTKRYQVLTLNVETEVVKETYFPFMNREEEMINKYFYMSTGRCLSLLIGGGGYVWQVWEMEPESGKWRKMPDIDLEAQKLRFEQNGETVFPVAWLSYPEVLVFRVRANNAYIFYNLRTHEIYRGIFGLPTIKWWQFLVHRESLVWMNYGR